MKTFTTLYAQLDGTTKTSDKVRALVEYFATADPADAAWAIALLIGRKPRQAVASPRLREWAAAESGISDWLFQESYDAVGDVAETIALLLPRPERSSDLTLSRWIEERLLPLAKLDDDQKRLAVVDAWRQLDHEQRFLWNKLLSGGFRVGVSRQLVIRALAAHGNIEPAAVAHRLMGDWTPTPAFFQSLLVRDETDTSSSRPYPFFLAHAIDQPPAALGPRDAWQAEWKWDGIRCQLIRRQGQTYLWTRGEELVTERYPELVSAAECLPDGLVLDGEILPIKNGQVGPFSQLQRRIGRKSVPKSILSEIPVVLFAYDLLEASGQDMRLDPLALRRGKLERLVKELGARHPAVAERIRLSPVVEAETWEQLQAAWRGSRAQQAEGLMLKDRGKAYGVGRERGAWWKWKVAPLTIDAVLTAARRGSGKRASLYTDYTFGVWHNGALVTIAQAYSGLTDQEIRQVDAFIRRNMVEKFGPVRTVKPELVFELAFEGLNRSSRHRSGVAVRFPRIVRIRTDKQAHDADSLETLKALLPPIEAHTPDRASKKPATSD